MFVVFFVIILWVMANRINVNNNGNRSWEIAAALTILVSLVAMVLDGVSWKYSLLLAGLLFPVNWLYFKISGRMNSITGFLLFLLPSILICLILPYYFTDKILQYHYWKKEQKLGISLIKSIADEIKSRNKDELAADVNSLQVSFENGKTFHPNHDNVEKLARLFILSSYLVPENQKYYEFRTRYIEPAVGLTPGCHFDFLILLYQKEFDLPQTMRKEPAFNSFCQGWNELDKEFEFWGRTPHGRSALQY